VISGVIGGARKPFGRELACPGGVTGFYA